MSELKLVRAWGSYGHGSEFTLWKSKEAAESHDLYEIEVVGLEQVYLSDSEIKELESGLPVFH